MASRGVTGRVIGAVVGLVVVGAAVWSVFMVDWRREKEEAPEPVRPLKSLVVGERAPAGRSYPARVRARQEVTLAFKVPGVVQSLPVVRGQRVERGEVLAQLDLRDFESRLAFQRARLAQAQNELEAATRAFELGGLNQIEFTRIRTSVDLSVSEVEIAEKALEDATMKAPFDGRIADMFIDQFENISVGQRILRVLDSAVIRVEVNVHEERVAFARRYEGRFGFTVTFDFLPGEEIPAKLVEFTTEAASSTQTFLAIFELEPPPGVTVLPGMTATVREYPVSGDEAPAGSVYVPMDAVVADSRGAHSVWVLKEEGGGVWSSTRRVVEAGEVVGDALRVRGGLSAGERIAAAGVHQLTEGQRVTLIPARRESGRGTR